MKKSKYLLNLQTEKLKEKWKDIPGFEGYYQVSTFGNIRSVERISYYKNGKRYTKRHYQGVNLSPSIETGRKNVYVTLCKDGEKYVASIQDIVFGTFKSTDIKIKKSNKRKQVKCEEDNIVFKSMAEASRYYNVTASTIKKYCQNSSVLKQKIKKNFKFVNE